MKITNKIVILGVVVLIVILSVIYSVSSNNSLSSVQQEGNDIQLVDQPAPVAIKDDFQIISDVEDGGAHADASNSLGNIDGFDNNAVGRDENVFMVYK